MIKICLQTRGREIAVSHVEKKCNKPRTAQVGFISKAQKYSRNNNWKHLEIFLSKKVFGKNSRILPKNSKRDPLGSINVFFTN